MRPLRLLCERTAPSVPRRLTWTCGRKMKTMTGSSEYLTGTTDCEGAHAPRTDRNGLLPHGDSEYLRERLYLTFIVSYYDIVRYF